MLALLTMVVALLIGFGAVQEFIVLGVGGGQTQPLIIGLAGTLVSLLLLVAAVALWRRWESARPIAAVAGALSIAFHVYAALPPHRNVGVLVLLIGAGYGLFLLLRAARRGGPPAMPPAPAAGFTR